MEGSPKWVSGAWATVWGSKNASKSVGGVAKMGQQGLGTYSGLQKCIDIRGRGGKMGKQGLNTYSGIEKCVEIPGRGGKNGKAGSVHLFGA